MSSHTTDSVRFRAILRFSPKPPTISPYTLAEIGQEYEVDPQIDLVPVCPNCHAIIHSESPPLPVDAVRKLLLR